MLTPAEERKERPLPGSPEEWNYEPLPAPIRVADHRWPAGTRPVVSVVTTTFNHRKFIRQCLEGLLMQETRFPVELLIHDDASTDGTSEIIREYQAKYPEVIRATLQTENQFSKGKSPTRFLRSTAKGNFIAYCEGDDFWTHPGKLQVQFELLESRPDVIMAAHDADVVDSDGNRVPDCEPTKDPAEPMIQFFTGKDIILGQYLRTLSVFHRNHRDCFRNYKPRRLVNGDRYLFAMLSVYGGTLVSSERMASYRVHAGGLWSGAAKDKQNINRVTSRLAIAHDINAAYCVHACRNLAGDSWSIAYNYLRAGRYARFVRFTYPVLVGWMLCFRAARAGPSYWGLMFSAQLRIASLPMVAIGRTVVHKFAKIFRAVLGRAD